LAPHDLDELLVRLLGDDLETATFRVVGFALIGAAVVALLVKLL
jgi:hypothetical protein